MQGVLSEAILDKVGVSNLFGMPWKIAKAGEGGPAPMWRNLSKFHSFNAWVYVRSGRRWTEWAGYPQEMLNGSGRRARIVVPDSQIGKRCRGVSCFIQSRQDWQICFHENVHEKFAVLNREPEF